MAARMSVMVRAFMAGLSAEPEVGIMITPVIKKCPAQSLKMRFWEPTHMTPIFDIPNFLSCR